MISTGVYSGLSLEGTKCRSTMTNMPITLAVVEPIAARRTLSDSLKCQIEKPCSSKRLTNAFSKKWKNLRAAVSPSTSRIIISAESTAVCG